MKKALIALIFTLIFHGTAMAADPGRITSSLTNLNNWLQNQGGITEINNTLQKTKAQAHEEWSDRAALYEFNFVYSVTGDTSIEIKLSSPENEENDYKGLCVLCFGEPETSLIENNPDVRHNIYGVKLLMRELIPALLEDERVVPLLEEVMGKDIDVDTSFMLTKNTYNHLYWTVTFTDINTDKQYMVITRADQEEASFIILRKRSL